MSHAAGSFEVVLKPLPTDCAPEGRALSRMSLDKRFHGDLEGTSSGEMLAVMTATSGSAGYVAMEFVTCALHGRPGTFVFQHSSTMTRGIPVQSVTVVPDSGTDGLAGLTGRMVIIVEGGAHSYEFDYQLG